MSVSAEQAPLRPENTAVKGKIIPVPNNLDR